MNTFEQLFPSITQTHISEFENRMGFSLPAKYKEFLLRQNGGQPSTNEFKISQADKSALVDLFYGIATSRTPGDLETEYEGLRNQLPKGFLAIGHDPGGNSLLLRTTGPMADRIYYWDVNHFFDTSDSTCNTYLIAENINELLESLKAGS